MRMDSQLKVEIRWLIRRDFEDVLHIENKSFDFPWTEEDFLYFLRLPNYIGMTAEHEGRIVGYMIYEVHSSKLNIQNFAVSFDDRRLGVGSQMIQRLIGKLSHQRRDEITLKVRETNLSAQLFFSKQGFEATAVLRNEYEDTEEDAYLMKFRLGDSYEH